MWTALKVSPAFVGLPWIAADLGFFLTAVPGIRSVFQTGDYLPQVAGMPPFPPAQQKQRHVQPAEA